MKKICMLFVGILLIILSNMGCALIPNIIPCDSNKNELYPSIWRKNFPPSSSLDIEGMGDSVLAFIYVQRFPIPQSAIDSSKHVYDSLLPIANNAYRIIDSFEKKWTISRKIEDSIEFINAINRQNIATKLLIQAQLSYGIGSKYKPMDTIYISKKNGEIIKNYTWKERSCKRLDSFLGIRGGVYEWEHYWYDWDSTIRKLKWKTPKYSGADDKNVFGMLWELIMGCSFAKTKLLDYKGYKIVLRNKTIDWGDCEKYNLRIYKGIKYYSIPLLNHQIRGYLIDSNSLYILFIGSSLILQCYNFEDMLPKEKPNKQ